MISGGQARRAHAQGTDPWVRGRISAWPVGVYPNLRPNRGYPALFAGTTGYQPHFRIGSEGGSDLGRCGLRNRPLGRR
jgi:hypothetical protein